MGKRDAGHAARPTHAIELLRRLVELMDRAEEISDLPPCSMRDMEADSANAQLEGLVEEARAMVARHDGKEH